jgi:5-methylthioadenosine/S-adenosylhomocysteine deaminase
MLFQRAREVAPTIIPASVALSLATIEGARALRLEGKVGSLEVGKAADLAAFPLSGSGPIFDPDAHAVLSLAGAKATLVTVAGRELVRDARLVGEDHTLVGRVQRSAEALGIWLRSESGRNMP